MRWDVVKRTRDVGLGFYLLQESTVSRADANHVLGFFFQFQLLVV